MTQKLNKSNEGWFVRDRVLVVILEVVPRIKVGLRPRFQIRVKHVIIVSKHNT